MEANELEYFRNTNISRLPIRIIHIPIPIQSLVFPFGRPGFISYHAPLLRSMRNLQRVKLKQTVSFESERGPIPGETRRSPRRSFSSLLLGRSILYFLFGALKYVKVRNLNMEVGITW